VFITLEGPEGGGKTTQAARLTRWLTAQGKNVLLVREPGSTRLGDAIRHLLLDFRDGQVDPRTEVLLFCAARAQLVSEKIKPHLAEGGVVVCDRFADSTLAYQGYARGMELVFLRSLLDFATYGLKPDLTLLLDIEAHDGLGRKTIGDEWNRLDAEELSFHLRVRDGYRQLASAEPLRWVTIDAGHPLDEVSNSISEVVAKRLLS
jgi:dTMP kinase